jgi:hypothetical protein
MSESNIALHTAAIAVIAAANAQQPIDLAGLLAATKDKLSLDTATLDALAKTTVHTDYTTSPPTFALDVPGNDLNIKIGLGNLDFKDIKGSLLVSMFSVTFTFPDGASSPRGQAVFVKYRLEWLSVDSANIVLHFNGLPEQRIYHCY